MKYEFDFFDRNALTEVCVLADVLAIAKEKNYMVLDPVPQESVEVKPMMQVYARKKALTGAGNLIIHGAQRLQNSQAELTKNRSTPDFHIELLRLRQNWRLKKVASSIIGDLSYRTGLYLIVYILFIFWNILCFYMLLIKQFQYSIDLQIFIYI